MFWLQRLWRVVTVRTCLIVCLLLRRFRQPWTNLWNPARHSFSSEGKKEGSSMVNYLYFSFSFSWKPSIFILSVWWGAGLFLIGYFSRCFYLLCCCRCILLTCQVWTILLFNMTAQFELFQKMYTCSSTGHPARPRNVKIWIKCKNLKNRLR